jgi:hypothetical protein
MMQNDACLKPSRAWPSICMSNCRLSMCADVRLERKHARHHCATAWRAPRRSCVTVDSIGCRMRDRNPLKRWPNSELLRSSPQAARTASHDSLSNVWIDGNAVDCFAKPHSDDGGIQGSAKFEAPIAELHVDGPASTVRQHWRKLLSGRRTQDERIDSDCSRSAEPQA